MGVDARLEVEHHQCRDEDIGCCEEQYCRQHFALLLQYFYEEEYLIGIAKSFQQTQNLHHTQRTQKLEVAAQNLEARQYREQVDYGPKAIWIDEEGVNSSAQLIVGCHPSQNVGEVHEVGWYQEACATP